MTTTAAVNYVKQNGFSHSRVGSLRTHLSLKHDTTMIHADPNDRDSYATSVVTTEKAYGLKEFDYYDGRSYVLGLYGYRGTLGVHHTGREGTPVSILPHWFVLAY